MRKAIAALALLCCCSMPPALAQVSFGFESPGISIGVNLPVYPNLVRIPGYPVYYAPNLDANYFFYDGLYWVFIDGNWYASSWYNGPWQLVSDDMVPLFILRVPVRYYRAPPVYFRSWARNAPPRWGEHWGASWERRHRGWDRWNRASAPAPAPLPTYQRQYTGNRYPRSVDQQRTLESRNYHYQPRDRFAREHARRGAPVQNAQTPRPNGRSNVANERRRSEPQSRGATPPVARQAVPPAPRATPPAVAQHRAPTTEQRAQAPRPEQRATAPRPEQRSTARAPAAPPSPAQARAAQSRPPQAQARGPEARPPQAQARGPEARPPQAQARAPQSRQPQAQARGPQSRPAEGRGQAQARHRGGNENARAGERRNENNG